MDKELIKKLLWVLLFAAGLFLIGEAKAHEYGHAEDIFHIDRGERTGWIEKSEWCWAGNTRQDKLLLYIDEDKDDVVELCATLWYEHGVLHYILSDPDGDENCECQGYLWFDGDSQGERSWDF